MRVSYLLPRVDYVFELLDVLELLQRRVFAFCLELDQVIQLVLVLRVVQLSGQNLVLLQLIRSNVIVELLNDVLQAQHLLRLEFLLRL